MNSLRLTMFAGAMLILLVMSVTAKADGSWNTGDYVIDPRTVTKTLDPPDDIEAASAGTVGQSGITASAQRTGPARK